MKHLFNRIAASNSKVIAHIKMGDDTFNIVSRDSSVYGVYGGCDIFKSATLSEPEGKIASLVKDFIKEYVKSSKCTGVTVLKDKSAIDLDSFLEQIKSIPGIKKVVIKCLPGDMTEINKSLRADFDVGKAVDSKNLVGSLQNLYGLVVDLNNTLKVCREDALTLTQGRMVDTMWGAKSMQQALCEISKKIADDVEWDRAEFFTTLITKSIECLIRKLSTDLSKVCAEEQKVICTVLIPNVLKNYEQLKAIASRALLPLSTLIYIDTAFKQATSYPATWFMNGNMLQDLEQDYQKILGFMMQIPRIEKSVIYPLDFLKMQYLSQTPSK